MHAKALNSGVPAPNRSLFALASETVLRAEIVGAAGLAVMLLWTDEGRLGLAAIFTAVVLLASMRLNRGEHQRFAFILAASALAALSGLLEWRLGWSGCCAWPLLGLAGVAVLNRRWDRGFVIGLCAVLTAAAGALLLRDLLRHGETHALTLAGSALWFVVGVIAASRVGILIRDSEKTAAQMRRVARTDLLTGLLDRSAIKETLGYEAARTNRSQRPFSMVVAGVDGFADLCEQYGERCGDWVLITVANLLKRVLRQQDHVSRWGADQFMILLPDTLAEGGNVAAERIAAEIERSTYLFDDREIDFSLTFAVVAYDGTRSLATCLEDLDAALTEDNPPGFVRIDDE